MTTDLRDILSKAITQRDGEVSEKRAAVKVALEALAVAKGELDATLKVWDDLGMPVPRRGRRPKDRSVVVAPPVAVEDDDEFEDACSVAAE